MSYTRPAANAANLSWSAAVVYARPAANAANFSFANGSPTFAPVTGFMPVRFGTPSYPHLVTAAVSGFRATDFGTGRLQLAQPVQGFNPAHFGSNLTLLPHAVGFKPVHFGASISLLPHAVGFRPTNFGTPAAYSHMAVLSWRPVQFGTPTVPTARTAAVSGWSACHFGRPTLVHFSARRRNLLAHAYRLRPVRFGTPTV